MRQALWMPSSHIKIVGDGTHGLEGAAVNRARAVLLERLDVLRRAVALVLREAVLRVDLVVLVHEAVTRDLRDDRGRRNRGGLRIALDDRLRGHRQAVERYRVNQDLLRRGLQ